MASGTPEALVGIEPEEHSATAQKIAQRPVEAMRLLAKAVAAMHCSVVEVVAREPVEAIRSPVTAAAQALVEEAIPPSVLEPIGAIPPLEMAVAATRDRAAVEVERLRSCHKNEHYRVALLRNWRIVAF